jgi:comEA protein
MQFFSFTPQEIKALLFLLTALLIGSGITVYKRHHPDFAPGLVFNQSPSSSPEYRSQSDEGSKDSPYPISRSSSATLASDLEVRRPRSQDESQSQVPQSEILSARQDPSRGKIDLNSASASELELLPHIGPVLSQRIVNYRKTKGKFQRIEDLMKVSGIGEKTFERIKNFITVN